MPEHTPGPALVITRIFDAPVERVWKAWTDPVEVMKWWGPQYFTAPVATMDFRVGGKYLFCMRGAPAPGAPVMDFWSTGVYQEIVPMKKLVCTDSFADPQGNVVPASYYHMPSAEDFPLEMLVTVEFKTQGNKTKLTLTHIGHPAGKVSEMARDGWSTSLDKLAESLR